MRLTWIEYAPAAFGHVHSAFGVCVRGLHDQNRHRTLGQPRRPLQCLGSRWLQTWTHSRSSAATIRVHQYLMMGQDSKLHHQRSLLQWPHLEPSAQCRDPPTEATKQRPRVNRKFEGDLRTHTWVGGCRQWQQQTSSNEPLTVAKGEFRDHYSTHYQ